VFAVSVVAGVDDVADVLACFGELLGGRCSWLWPVEQFGQVSAAVSATA
jgi:hypothetical protein